MDRTFLLFIFFMAAALSILCEIFFMKKLKKHYDDEINLSKLKLAIAYQGMAEVYIDLIAAFKKDKEFPKEFCILRNLSKTIPKTYHELEILFENYDESSFYKVREEKFYSEAINQFDQINRIIKAKRLKDFLQENDK